MVKVAVAGASGYAGENSSGCSSRTRGRDRSSDCRVVGWAEARRDPPHLTPLAERVVEDTTREVLAGHDAVFLAPPHGHSAALATALPAEVVIIDCGPTSG